MPLTLQRLQRPAWACASGLLLVLSFPKFGHGLVAWVALVPLMLTLRQATPRGAAGLGYLAGFVSSVGLLYWTALVVTRFGGLSGFLAVLVMLLLCAVVALFYALFAWSVVRSRRIFGTGALLLAPVFWVAMEMLRAYTLYRFPWCLLGYSQYGFLESIQIARFTAVYGVSFVVVAPAAVVAYFVHEHRTARRRFATAGLALLLASVWAYGSWRVQRVHPEKGRLAVALVQANVHQEDKWDPAKAVDNVARHVALTRQTGTARLVVWPESAVPYYYDRTPSLRAGLQRLIADRQIYLLFGNDDTEETESGPRVYVGAKMLAPDGQLTFRHHKMRLVPFGEYVPLKHLLTLGGRVTARLVQSVADFTPGEAFVVGQADGHRLAALICYEVIFPDLARQFVVRGADLLVNITNDAWYGRTSAPHQHLMMAVLRAVENGKVLVRAANTGISAVIDPAGRIIARTELFEPRVLVQEVPLVEGMTFYARHGDVFGWSCLVLAAVLLVLTQTKLFGCGRRPR